jgi:predicted glycogen debranching enzyme
MTFEQKVSQVGGGRARGVEKRAVPAQVVGREACVDFARSSLLEWIETNGTGGFAMGTAAGVNTRRYHGLLVGALEPPVDRFVFLSKVEETVDVEGREHDLATTQYPGAVHPQGYRALESFRLDPFPIWTYALGGGAVVEKRVFLVHGKQTVVVQYRANRECRLRVRPFLAYRDFHGLTRANDALDPRVTHERRAPDAATMRMTPYAGLPQLVIHHGGAASSEGASWYRDAEYLAELDRGLEFREDLYCAGTIEFALAPDRPAWIVATVEKNGDWDFVRVASEEAVQRERRRTTERDPFVARLANAANAYRVRRKDGSPTIIAGYPWFADWGRDTMIALPGLLLARGLLDEARDVLTGFLEHLSDGIVPNRFVDGGEPPEYNTVDGTLWMFHAVHEYIRAGGDQRWVRDVFYPRAKAIVAWHQRGTHHGIHVDPADGLLVGGDRGTQLTWMDAKIGDWVVTPRHGKPVEINALWFFALRLLEELAIEYRDAEYAAEASAAARRVAESFARAFWNGAKGCLYDVILPEGPDARIRPNQIFAVSLPYSPLTPEQKASVVRVVERELVTPLGLRTLARGELGYRPRYEGDPVSRDSAYHQGTVWPWLIGPYATAYLNAFGRTAETRAHVRALLVPLERHLDEACLGQVSEVLDADEPHRPGGAPAQAWSVAEILRVLKVELELP